MTNAKKHAELEANLRDDHGKGAARALRRDGKVPGILYGKGQKPVSISLPLKDLTLEYNRGRFRSRLVNIKLSDGKTVEALPKDLQFHPVTDVIEHVDFIKVEPGLELRVNVPVKFLGQEKAAGLKRGGVLNIVRHEIEFMCAPDAIPSHIEINIQQLNIGDSVHIKDIDLPKGITPMIKRNFTVATIAGRAKEEEKVTETAEAEATDAKKEDAPAADAKKADAKKEDAKK